MTVTSGDRLRFNMYISRCGSLSIDNGVWAPSSVAFIPLHPTRPMPSIHGVLNNQCNGGTCTFTTVEASDATVLAFSGGELKALSAGVISIDWHQDLIHSCSYAYISIKRINANGQTTELLRELMAHTSSRWDGIHASGNFLANAGDTFRLQMVCSAISNIDNGYWGIATATLFPTK